MVPSALTSKSTIGMSRALSWDGCAAQWTIRSKRWARKSVFEANAVTNVQIVMRKVSCDSPQSTEIPRCVAGITKENPPHIVVDAVNLAALPIKMFDSFRPNETAGTCNKNCFRGHGLYSLRLTRIGKRKRSFSVSIRTPLARCSTIMPSELFTHNTGREVPSHSHESIEDAFETGAQASLRAPPKAAPWLCDCPSNTRRCPPGVPCLIALSGRCATIPPASLQ